MYEAQVVNYGRRLMLEFSIPEPAAYYRVLEASQRLSGLTKKKPDKPTGGVEEDGKIVDLQPDLIVWPDVQEIAAEYGAAGIQPPPPEKEIIGTSIEVPFSDKDYEKNAAMGLNRVLPALGGTKVSSEIKITKGYRVKRVTWSGASRAYIRKKNPLQDKKFLYS